MSHSGHTSALGAGDALGGGAGGAVRMGLAAKRLLQREENVFTFSTKPADT